MVAKEKLQVANHDMKLVIRTLENQIQQLSSKDDLDKTLDRYIKEIEELKHRISKYDNERKELLKKLESQSHKVKSLQKKMLDVETSINEGEGDDTDGNETYRLTESKVSHALASIHPEKTFTAFEIQKDTDKDEEIIALQNKIIAFNQQHLHDMKELKADKDRQLSKALQDRDQNIHNYLEKIRDLEQENDQIRSVNDDLRENLLQNERILEELESELFESPVKNTEIIKTEKPKHKKNKKVIPKDLSSSGVSEPGLQSSLIQQPRQRFQLKSTEFVIYPNRIIKLLIEAKKSEAKALIECRRLDRTRLLHLDTIGNCMTLILIDSKEHYIRQLEDEIQLYKQKYSGQDYDTFGNSHNAPQVTDSSHLHRRIDELESQVSELRLKEQERIAQMISDNRHKANDINANAHVDGYQGIHHAMLDAIAVLAYELCESELKEYTSRYEGQANATQFTNRTFTKGNFGVAPESMSVEMSQRMVIKYLNNTLTRLLSNNESLAIGNSNEYIPNEEGDRAVWYLELLESQLDITDRTLKALKDFTEKISIQISGSISSAAQVKATSLELASNTKSTAEEVNQLKNVIKLIYTDLSDLKASTSQPRDIVIPKEETFLRANMTSSDISHNASNIFELSEAYKLRQKLNLITKQKEDLDSLITELSHLVCPNEPPTASSLKPKI